MSDNLSLIDTMNKNEKFSTFVRMLRSSKAADLIVGAGPFTVFAPTNDAFGKVPDAQVSSWLNQTDQTDLAKVLSNHIVPAKLFASNLTGKGTVATLSGADVSFSDSNGLKVNTSGIQARNIEATNGIIHALDTVLIPTASAMAASAATTAPSAAPAAAPATPQADGHSDATSAQATPENATPAAAKPALS